MTLAQDRILPQRAARTPLPDGTPRRNGALSLKFWIGISISIVFLYLALRGQDFGALWTAMREA